MTALGEPRQRPLIFAHRGASGYRPEHTIAAYELAVAMGADYIEPDLVMTRDGVLVDRHEPEIGGTTDVSSRPEFADRHTIKEVDGRAVRGWFVEDFDAEELRTLRAVERLPRIRPGNRPYDGEWWIPTFAELLELRERLSRESGREIGIIPEIKHSTYLHEQGFNPEAATMELVEKAGLNHPRAALWIQSFEVGNLIALRERYGFRANLLFLNEDGQAPYDFVVAGDGRGYDELLTPRGLGELARWVDAIGPEKVMVIPRRSDGSLGEPTGLVDDAHAEGLQVIPWTFRAENHFLPTNFRVVESDGTVLPWRIGNAQGEALTFLDAGIDAVFGDHPDIYVSAVEAFMQRAPGSDS